MVAFYLYQAQLLYVFSFLVLLIFLKFLLALWEFYMVLWSDLIFQSQTNGWIVCPTLPSKKKVKLDLNTNLLLYNFLIYIIHVYVYNYICVYIHIIIYYSPAGLELFGNPPASLAQVLELYVWIMMHRLIFFKSIFLRMLGIESSGHMCARHPSPVGLRPARPRFLCLCDTPEIVCSAGIVIRICKDKSPSNAISTGSAPTPQLKTKSRERFNKHVAERDKKRIQWSASSSFWGSSMTFRFKCSPGEQGEMCTD